MLRKKDSVSLEDFKAFGFKYGTRDRFLYKTKTNGLESILYISLLPCNNNHNELKIDLGCRQIPDKLINKIYDLIQAGLIEKVGK